MTTAKEGSLLVILTYSIYFCHVNSLSLFPVKFVRFWLDGSSTTLNKNYSNDVESNSFSSKEDSLNEYMLFRNS